VPSLPEIYHTIVAVDMAEFIHPARTEHHRLAMLRGLDEILATAFDGAGIPWERCSVEDRGDGKLITMPYGFHWVQAFELLPNLLLNGLTRHNALHVPEAGIRLRMAVNAGHVTTDVDGKFGPAIFTRSASLTRHPSKGIFKRHLMC
jgi:hypothetical protein